MIPNCTPILTIIMPVYNEEKYVAFAIESVMLQVTEYPFVLLFVDDASTDSTLSIAKRYQEHINSPKRTHSLCSMEILSLRKNRGKGHAMYTAYKRMVEYQQGGFFCVLDGDDFYTRTDKIQRQIRYLNNNPDFFASGHEYCTYSPTHGIIAINASCQDTVHYKDVPVQGYSNFENTTKLYYSHTSSIMYRNIFSSPIPTYFAKNAMRGDSTLLFWHELMTRKKIGHQNILASCYNFHGEGIWSGSTIEEKVHLLLETKYIMQDLCNDKESLEQITEMYDYILYSTVYNNKEISSNSKDCSNINSVYDNLQKIISYIAFSKENNYIWNGPHCSLYLDSFTETLGKTIVSNTILTLNKSYNENVIALLIPGFVVQGGGIFGYIRTIVHCFREAGKEIYIVSTGYIENATEIFEEYFGHDEGIHFIEFPHSNEPAFRRMYEENIRFLVHSIYSIAPEKLYCFISHTDVVGSSVMQKGIAKEIILDFVYDHGFVHGLCSSAIDTILVHTISAFTAVYNSNYIPAEKILYIPLITTLLGDMENAYTPKHTTVQITASASVRPNKIESKGKYDYAEIIGNILKITQGKHYHFGMLSDDYLLRIQNILDANNIPSDAFVYIPYSSTFLKDLLEYEVDVFIATFPIYSLTTAISISGLGIPIIDYEGEGPLECGALCHYGTLIWKKPKELYTIIRNLNAKKMKQYSATEYAYYKKYNHPTVVKKLYIEHEGLPIQPINHTFEVKNVHIDYIQKDKK